MFVQVSADMRRLVLPKCDGDVSINCNIIIEVFHHFSLMCDPKRYGVL